MITRSTDDSIDICLFEAVLYTGISGEYIDLMNGYFQLVIGKSGTGVRVFDATDGCAEVTTGEITEYLDRNRIGYDILAVNEAVKKKGAEPVYFTQNKVNPVREQYVMTIAQDQMSVSVRFYPPSENVSGGEPGQLTDSKEVIGDLVLKKIRFGVDKDAIDNFFSNREYCKDIVIARGKLPRDGSDAVIEYKFGTSKKPRPSLNEDGSVDYHNLNIINHCKEGDLLAVLTPADMGGYGTSVYGNQVKPRSVKVKSLHFGQNVKLSEDKLTISAEKSGHVSLQDGKVVVSNVLNLKNVDVATGNIDYDGSVAVAGNIASGFSVKAGGNIEVKGTIEGAVLEAGADIILERGVNGAGGGLIKAGGNIVTKFIENAKVVAGGSVNAESILHSDVQAGTEVNVTGNKGFIVGGHVIAGESINVITIGGEMGTTTRIDVGVDPSLKVRIRDLMKEIGEENKNLQQIRPTIDGIVKKLQAGTVLAPDQAAYAKKLMAMKAQLESDINEKSENLMELQDTLSQTHNAYVTVNGICNAGTVITIGELSMTVDKAVKYSKFVEKEGDVRVAPLD